MGEQPKWKRVVNLGDENPLDYGGYMVFVDELGNYPPEAEYWAEPIGEDDTARYTVYRFILEDCTYVNGVLSDNKYHPNKPAWFAGTEAMREDRPQDSTYLANLVGFSDRTIDELVADFTANDPIRRAYAWREVGEYHGWDNLDNYPLELSRKEMEERYPEFA